MRRTLTTIGAVTLLIVIASAWRTNPPNTNPALHGAWAVSSWEIDGQSIDEPQPGLMVFTETHYSMMYVHVAEARPQYEGEQMTDAEILAAYNTLTANSGRYEVSGNELTTRAYVAKDPNYMASWPDNANTYTFRIEGETLHLEWPSDWPGGKRSARLMKVEGRPAPW